MTPERYEASLEEGLDLLDSARHVLPADHDVRKALLTLMQVLSAELDALAEKSLGHTFTRGQHGEDFCCFRGAGGWTCSRSVDQHLANDLAANLTLGPRLLRAVK